MILLTHLKLQIAPLLFALLILSSCSNEETYQGFDSSVSSSTPNKYFEFFNQQSTLAAGYYTIIVATKTPNISGDFTLGIDKNDGNGITTTQENWNNSFGESMSPWTTCLGSNSNTCFDLVLEQANGVSISVASADDAVIYLVNQHDSPTILKTTDEVTTNSTEVLSFSSAQIKDTSYATAYYQAVDINNERDTLQKYITLHGLDGTDVTHVTFRDSKDLGYGRDMYMRSYFSPDCGGQQVTAFYVRNFKVDVVEDFAYGLVNLEAAIEENLDYHFGSNAIEFSKGFDSLSETCADEPYNRFFTYKSDYSTPDASHPRLEQVDLDGRGEKAMPQPCISCHGGIARPLDRFGRFVTVNANDSVNQIGDTKSQLQAFEVDTFQFSNATNKTQSDFEDGLRILNSAVFCTYAGSLNHAACNDFGNGIAAQTDNGEWNGDFARDMMLGAYNNMLEVDDTPYQAGYVPDGWKPKVGKVPEGADTLFTKVISPNCFVCHGKRGSSLGSNRNASANGKDIDFSTWQKFISHAEEIKTRVFEEGRMPLGLLNYNNFWDDEEKAELLASFIASYVTDFTKHVDSDNNIIKPGNAVARAGLDRITKVNAAITINANSSLFVNTYDWQLTSSPIGSNPIISATDKAMFEFEPDMEGEYIFQLTASNTNTLSVDTDEILIKVDDSLTIAPRDLVFYDHVKDTLIDCASLCHSQDGFTNVNTTAAGIPVWWSDDNDQPLSIPSNTSDFAALGLYEQFKTRTNLKDIEDSLVLKKPSNIHHFGGVTALSLGFDTSKEVGSVERASYDLYVNWITEGAVCGGTNIQCPTEE